MECEIYKNAIKSLPTFFNNSIQVDTSGGEIFSTLKNLVDFNEAYIFFLNPDSIQLKYAFGTDETPISAKIKKNSVFQINEKLKKELFSTENFSMESKTPLTNLLNLQGKSFLVSKLSIRKTVYGFLLLCSNKENFYTPEYMDVVGAASAIISYMIKDIELSNVFKIQLKALKDGIIETNSAYKTIKEQNLKILETDRIKNEFLANISHELRTPLNAIIGFSEVLSAKLFGELNEKQAEYVSDINVSGIHLLGMINEILDISKIEAHAMSLNRTDFELSLAVNEVVNVIKPLADKKSIVVEKIIKNDNLINADFQKISQILYNLLSNAIKFSNEGGKIEIYGEVTDKGFVLKIKDNGIGIDEKYYGKIFAKFVQLESSYTKKESSTGLGLTITKELVEMHGGQISLTSEVNKGTTFIVEIPNA